MAGERGTLDGGRWTVDGGRWTVDGGRWTADGGRWTVDGGRWTADGGRWAAVVDYLLIISEVSRDDSATANRHFKCIATDTVFGSAAV